MMDITWAKLAHDFADDASFLRVADITGASVALVQACFARALCRASSNPDRGSLDRIDFDEFAWWFREPVELIRSIFECWEKITRQVKDGRLANWAKRQGAAAAKLAQVAAAKAEEAVTAAALRTRRWRQKKARDPRQQEMFFVVPGGAEATAKQASPKRASQASHPVAPPSPQASPSAADKDSEIRFRESPLEAPPSGGRPSPFSISDGGMEVLPPEERTERYARRSRRPTRLETTRQRWEAGRRAADQAWLERTRMAGRVDPGPLRRVPGYD
jgi:hypothetical protein